MKNLVIAAHLDDEILGMGGFLALKSYEGDQNTIITVCRGRDQQNFLKRSEVVEEFCTTFHINHIILTNWDLSLDKVSRAELGEKIFSWIEFLGLKWDRIFIPSSKDVHFEHRIVSDVAKVAIRNVKFQVLYEVKNPGDPFNTDIFDTSHLINNNIFDKVNFVKKFTTENIPEIPDYEFFKTIKASI